MPRVVFISYSHDSAEHREKVLSLAERLRQDGLDAQLDQYVEGTPTQGWPRWMLDRLDEAAFVLVVCTETYYRRFRGHELPSRGRGVDWEGALITQETYDAKSRTEKFVPLALAAGQEPFVPEPLRGHTYYELTSEEAYEALYRFLLGRAGVKPSPLGDLRSVPDQSARPLTFDPTPVPLAPAENPRVGPALAGSGSREGKQAAPSPWRSLPWLALPTLVLLPLLVFATYWHVPTRVQLEVPTARIAITPGGEESRAILAPEVVFSSLVLEDCGTVMFWPESLEIADPQSLVPVDRPGESRHLSSWAWHKLTLTGPVKFHCDDPSAKMTLRSVQGGRTSAGTLGVLHFQPGAQVILEALSGLEPSLSVEVEKPLRLSLPLAAEVQVVTDFVQPDGINLPFSGDLLAYRVRLPEGRRPLEVESGPRGLVLIVTPTPGQLGTLFAERLDLPVVAVEFLGEDREGEPGTQLLGEATLSYPEYRGILPVTIGEDEAIGLRGLSKARLSSLELGTKDLTKVAIRAKFDGVVEGATSRAGEFSRDFRLTLYHVFRYSWRWGMVAVAAVWLLSTSWVGFEVWKKIRE